MLMSKPGFEVYVLVLPITPAPVPFGYVYAFDQFTGQSWQSLVHSSVGTLVPLQVSSFSIKLVFNPLVPGQYSYDVLYNSCEWGTPVIGHVNSSRRHPIYGLMRSRARPLTGPPARAGCQRCGTWQSQHRSIALNAMLRCLCRQIRHPYHGYR